LQSYFQHTLSSPVRVSGVGVHTGELIDLTISPAPADNGIAFMRTDAPEDRRLIRACADCVADTRLGTVIANADGVQVSTVEHLMAALFATGVDNAVVELDGPEVPILDGCSAAFVAAIDAGGLRRQATPRRHIEILAPVEVTHADKRASLSPAPCFEMAVEIAFDALAIGRQRLELVMDEATFRAELAEARTFGFLAEVEQLRAAGLGRGASLENTLVVDADRVLNPELLARADDFVRHKMLDALGDLYILGSPIIGRYEASKPGHALNHALVQALLARREAWRFVTRTPELAAAG